MEKLPLFSLPYPSTEAIHEPKLVDEDRGLLLTLVCDDDGHERHVGVLFTKPRAFRKRAEIYCTVWHCTDTYDTVCTINKSDWVDELQNDALPGWRDRWLMHHFIIYVDSFGCLEVIAESAVLDGGAKNSSGT